MILFGASGHAKVIADIIHAQGGLVPYMLDDNETVKELMDIEVRTFNSEMDLQNEETIVSIGVNHIRKRVVAKLVTQFGVAIHPKAVLSPNVSVGAGSVVMAGAIINSSVYIGKHAIVNTACSIDHDCSIADFTHISPGAVLCGGVSVGEGAHVGAGATIIQGITIGKWTTIGAGAVIIEDIPDGAVVVGNPGRIIKIKDVEE